MYPLVNVRYKHNLYLFDIKLNNRKEYYNNTPNYRKAIFA